MPWLTSVALLSPDGHADGFMSTEDFVQLLNTELEKFNNFFMEKEEEFVIRMHGLKERMEHKVGAAVVWLLLGRSIIFVAVLNAVNKVTYRMNVGSLHL